MIYIIAVFKSRKETMDLKFRMEERGIKCSTVNTPTQLKSGCGISLRFESRGYNLARCFINQSFYQTFLGFYKYDEKGHLVNA